MRLVLHSIWELISFTMVTMQGQMLDEVFTVPSPDLAGIILRSGRSFRILLWLIQQRGFGDITRSNSKYLSWIPRSSGESSDVMIMKTCWQIPFGREGAASSSLQYVACHLLPVEPALFLDNDKNEMFS